MFNEYLFVLVCHSDSLIRLVSIFCVICCCRILEHVTQLWFRILYHKLPPTCPLRYEIQTCRTNFQPCRRCEWSYKRLVEDFTWSILDILQPRIYKVKVSKTERYTIVFTSVAVYHFYNVTQLLLPNMYRDIVSTALCLEVSVFYNFPHCTVSFILFCVTALRPEMNIYVHRLTYRGL